MVVVQAFEYSGDVQHGVPPPGGHRLPQAGLAVLLFYLYLSFLVTTVADSDSYLDPVVPWGN
jgi:hypothetical protein